MLKIDKKQIATKFKNSGRLVKLSDVCNRIHYGFTASADFSITEPRLLRITDIQDGSVNWDTVPGCKITPTEEADNLLINGDIVIARTGATTGKSFLIQNPPRAVFASYLIRIQPSNKILPQYLYTFCQSSNYWKQIEANARGAAQEGVNATLLSSLILPLPPLEEQKRIAAIAQKADRLRRTRRYALQLSDTFLQSIFLEMFGDPVTNPKGWDSAKVADLGNVQTGNTPSRAELDNYGNYIEWIKSDNIIDGNFYVEKSKEMLSEKGLKEGRFVDVGSILVTCIAGSAISIGNVALTNRKVAFNQQINSVTPKKGVNSLFLYGLFLICKPFIQKNTTLGMKRIITKSRFENLLLIKPPLSLQEKFAQIVQKVERLRTQQREAERQAEHLFQTILHRAFRGELTSWDINEEPASDRLEQSAPKPTKPETTVKAGDTSTRDIAKNPDSKAKPQDAEAIQLKLPGFE